jgi:hypothetical protein
LVIEAHVAESAPPPDAAAALDVDVPEDPHAVSPRATTAAIAVRLTPPTFHRGLFLVAPDGVLTLLSLPFA